MLRPVILFAAMIAAAPLQPAFAKPAIPVDELVFQALEVAAKTPTVDADEAAAIVSALIFDADANAALLAADPQLQALLQAFAGSQQPFAVTSNAKTLMVGPLQPEAAEFMTLVFGSVPNPLAIWQKGPDRVKLHMARMYALPVQKFKNDVAAIVAADLMEGWRGSNIGNNYEPLRQKLGNAGRIFDGASPALRRTGRALLFRAMKDVDRQANDSVPDSLYRPFGE